MRNEIEDLRKIAKRFKEQLSPIKLFLMDVDGILTNGIVFFQGQEMGFNRYFHVSDGYIIKVLQENGVRVGIISGGDSLGLKKRMELLKVEYLYMGNEDKRTAYLDLKKKLSLSDEEILYMGDELFDIPLMKKAGFSATVPHAPLEVMDIADYITTRRAGEGAVREVADILRYVQNIHPEIPDFED